MKNISYLCSRKSTKKNGHMQILERKNVFFMRKAVFFYDSKATPYLLIF